MDFSEIYDTSAVRVLVPTLEDCYTALGIVHVRTYEMHDEAELGVTAHWKYKKGKKIASNYEKNKLAS